MTPATTATATTPPVVTTPAPTSVPTPRATPSPEPRGRIVTSGGCCGLFSWIDAHRLLLFDAPSAGSGGSFVLDAASGKKTALAAEFGQPSTAGLIAMPDMSAGVTRILDTTGHVRYQIQNQAAPTWIAPNGLRIVWLERLPLQTPSSLLARPVQLWEANVDGSNAHPLLKLLTSSAQWLADSRRLVLAGRTLDAGSPGVWIVDSDTGSYRVLVPARFVQAVQLSPDSTRVAYLVTFSGNPAQDGIWVAEIDSPKRWHLSDVGGFRWDDSQHLWLLQLAPASGGNDHLDLVNVETEKHQANVALDARVLNDQWQVSPDGRMVALWREEDHQVEVFGPLP